MTTLITGATGSIGRLVVARLLEHDVDVQALSRNPATAGLPDRVPVLEGGLRTAPAAAFEDVDTVYLFPADDGVDRFVERALAAGVTRFVVLSSLAVSGRHDRDAGSASALHHRAVEQAVTSRTDGWTMIRPGNLANNLLFWAYPIRSGLPVRMPYPTSSQVLLHETDVAAAAAHALTADEQGGLVVELTGPAAATKAEQLAAIAEAVGHDLPYVEVSPDEFRADMAPFMPAGVVELLLRYWSETVDEPEVPIDSPFGRTPLARWALDHRAAFAA